MSSAQNMIKYVKHNRVRIKTGIKREEITKILLKFFEEIKDKSTGMKGFMVMNDLQDIQAAVNSIKCYYIFFMPVGNI